MSILQFEHILPILSPFCSIDRSNGFWTRTIRANESLKFRRSFEGHSKVILNEWSDLREKVKRPTDGNMTQLLVARIQFTQFLNTLVKPLCHFQRHEIFEAFGNWKDQFWNFRLGRWSVAFKWPWRSPRVPWIQRPFWFNRNGYFETNDRYLSNFYCSNS